MSKQKNLVVASRNDQAASVIRSGLPVSVAQEASCPSLVEARQIVGVAERDPKERFAVIVRSACFSLFDLTYWMSSLDFAGSQ